VRDSGGIHDCLTIPVKAFHHHFSGGTTVKQKLRTAMFLLMIGSVFAAESVISEVEPGLTMDQYT
jgi:hypothetical protein